MKYFHSPSIEELHEIVKIPEYEWTQSSVVKGGEFAWVMYPTTRMVWRCNEYLLVKNNNSTNLSVEGLEELATWQPLQAAQGVTA